MENRYKTFTNLIVHISRSIQKIKNEEMSLLGFKGTQVQCLFSLYSLDLEINTRFSCIFFEKILVFYFL